jgi:hypothetical protein
MSSISFHISSRLGFGANRTLTAEFKGSFSDVWKPFQLCGIALTAVTLAACAQSSSFTDKSALVSSRETSLEFQSIICR